MFKFYNKLRIYSSDITKLQFFIDIFLTIIPFLKISYLGKDLEFILDINNIFPNLFLFLLL